jgi:hypothetical protein
VDAQNRGAKLLQIESPWVFFKGRTPYEASNDLNYVAQPGDGSPTPGMCALATSVGVHLRACGAPADDVRDARDYAYANPVGPTILEGQGYIEAAADASYCSYTSVPHAEVNSGRSAATFPVLPGRLLAGLRSRGICPVGYGFAAVSGGPLNGVHYLAGDGTRCVLTSTSLVASLYHDDPARIRPAPATLLAGLVDTGICRVPIGSYFFDDAGLGFSYGNNHYCGYMSSGHLELNSGLKVETLRHFPGTLLNDMVRDGVCPLGKGDFAVVTGPIQGWLAHDGAGHRCSYAGQAHLEALGGSLARLPVLPAQVLATMQDRGLCQPPPGYYVVENAGVIATPGDGTYCGFTSNEHAQIDTGTHPSRYRVYPQAILATMRRTGICPLGPGYFKIVDSTPQTGYYRVDAQQRACAVTSFTQLAAFGGPAPENVVTVGHDILNGVLFTGPCANP